MVWCREGGRERDRERGREGEVGGFGLMTNEYYMCNVGFFLCTFLPSYSPYPSKWYGAREGREEEEERGERGREGEVGRFGLMTPGLSKDIRCHV